VTPGAPGAASKALVNVAGTRRSAATKELPSAIPAFLEACGKLAGEATARGEHVQARELIELAGCLASANDHGR
jgi:hypothetical protein